MLTIFIINKDISLNEVVEEVLDTSVCFVYQGHQCWSGSQLSAEHNQKVTDGDIGLEEKVPVTESVKEGCTHVALMHSVTNATILLQGLTDSPPLERLGC